jgi:hypothetical protein
MNKIKQLAQQAQEITPPNEQLNLIILILQDAIRRLELLKENVNE